MPLEFNFKKITLLVLLLTISLFASGQTSWSFATIQNPKTLSNTGQVRPIDPIDPIDTIGFGFGEDYLLWKQAGYLESWQSLLSRTSKWKFDTVRLAFRFADSSGKEHSVLNYTKLDEILNLLQSKGYRAILDLHNFQDMPHFFGSDAWINDWVNLATRYRGDARIVAFELFNEPYDATWDATHVKQKADITKTFARATDAVRQVDPSRKVVWSDPYFYSWLDIAPANIRTNVSFGVHWWANTDNATYEAGVTQRKQTRAYNWNQKYGGVWLGEFGIFSWKSTSVQYPNFISWVNWSVDNKIGFSIWIYSNNPTTYDNLLSQSKYSG